jgi:hypothetical protein
MSRYSRTDVTPYRQAGSCLALGKTSSRSSGGSCSRPRPCSFNPAATMRSHDARLGCRIDGHVGQSRPSRQTQVGAARPSAPRRSGRRGYRAKKSSRLMDDTEQSFIKENRWPLARSLLDRADHAAHVIRSLLFSAATASVRSIVHGKEGAVLRAPTDLGRRITMRIPSSGVADWKLAHALAGFFLHSFPFQATINWPIRYAGSGSLPLKREGVRYANRCSASKNSL